MSDGIVDSWRANYSGGRLPSRDANEDDRDPTFLPGLPAGSDNRVDARDLDFHKTTEAQRQRDEHGVEASVRLGLCISVVRRGYGFTSARATEWSRPLATRSGHHGGRLDSAEQVVSAGS
jgi:hypothetical protein